MSILIGGMKLPEIEENKCIKAEIRNIDGQLRLGIMTGGYSCSQEWTYYPLDAIQAHGNLIDVDALLKQPCDIAERYGGGFQDEGYLRDTIEHAPVVIPASE